MKKLLCILLSILMLTSTFFSLNIVTYAEDDEEYIEEIDYASLYPYNSTSKCYYEINDNETPDYTSDDYATFIRYDGTGTTYTLPTALGGYSVKAIGPQAFKGNTKLTKITISASIITIDAEAFSQCTALKEFDTASNGDGKFSDNSGILYYNSYERLVAFPMAKATSLTIPTNVKEIGDKAFYGNTKIKTIEYKSDCKITKIGNSAFYGCTALSTLTIKSTITTIGDSAFEGCSALKTLSIPSTVTTMGSNVLAYCSYLTSTNVPTGMDNIPDGLFDGCASLSSISIPSNIKTIGARSFAGCTGLTSITVPNTVVTIGDSAFEACELVKSISIGTGVTSIGSGAFAYCSSAVDTEEDGTMSLTIPGNVKTIGEYAFEGCLALKTLTLNEGLETIGNSAFAACDILASINFPKSVTSIGTGVVDLCNSLSKLTVTSGNSYYTAASNILYNKDKTTLICYPINLTSTSFTIPSTVTTIGQMSFANNPYITKVTIGSSVKVIEDGAFNTCESLETVSINSSVQRIGVDAFANTYWYITKEEALLEDGGGVMYIGKILYTYVGDTYPTSITTKSDTTRIEDGALANLQTYDEETGKYTGLTTVTLKDSVTSIGDNAFSGCEILNKVTFGSGLTEIGDDAFSNCRSLTTLSLPSKLITIGNHAFSNCSKITSITIPKSVTSIGESILQHCTALTTISVTSGNTGYCSVNNVLYDAGQKTLMQYPLGSTATSFEIPKGVTKITHGSFSGVVNLTDVTIPNTVVDFGAIEYTGDDGTVTLTSDTFLDEANVITIHAYEGSAAETYANDNKIPFVALIVTGQIVSEGGSIKYLYSNDTYAQGWVEDGNKRYYFDKQSCALIGYKLVGAMGYNFDSTGAMVEECGKLGDTNHDGNVNVRDVTQSQKLGVNLVAKTDKNTLLGDVDGNGKVDVRDATNMQLYLAKKISKFPVVVE